MIVQRWGNGRAQYRPAGEVICTRDYTVTELDNTAARAFITRHHYSRAYPAARFRYALIRRNRIVGVAVYSHPCRDTVLTSVFPVPAIEAVELGRFVLLDDVPGNGETWFLARTFAMLKRSGIVGVVSFSDPVPRTDEHGHTIFPGHIGTIYQAHNGRYLGRSRAQVLHLLPDGTVFSARAASKIRSQDRGHRYASEILERYGAQERAPDVDPRSWLTSELARITRKLKHGGNHKYAWALDPGLRKHILQLSAGHGYPKQRDEYV